MIGQEIRITPGSGIVIHHKGEFNLDQVYNKAKSWIDSMRYDLTEKEHTIKKYPDLDETIISLIAEREIDDYAKFSIQTNFLVRDKNKKSGSCKGRIKINIISKIELDYKNKWKKTRTSSILFYVYNNFIIHKKIKEYKTKLTNEFNDYNNLIKEVLGKYT
ncbi:MAG: hypothetical protein KKG60_00955 [Nanoarchaeota archaeon]|nr:hypothetical protein [Nanoarchaeota archaeon]